ncbi:MAG: hypothetical protein WC785_08130 [Tatlockia sp.]|jgi:hypothetical protein
MDITMAIRVKIILVEEEYVVTGIATEMYSNLVDKMADLFVIATRNIIYALMGTPGIAVLVVNLEVNA